MWLQKTFNWCFAIPKFPCMGPEGAEVKEPHSRTSSKAEGCWDPEREGPYSDPLSKFEAEAEIPFNFLYESSWEKITRETSIVRSVCCRSKSWHCHIYWLYNAGKATSYLWISMCLSINCRIVIPMLQSYFAAQRSYMLGAHYRYPTNVAISIFILVAVSITVFIVTWPYQSKF